MLQPSPGVGVAAIIRKGDQVLLLRRKNVHGSGTWSTPGGHLELNETPEECAVRETLEETGLAVNNPRFVALTNDIFEVEHKHYITIWMEVDYAGGEPTLSAPEESDQVGWFPWERMPQPLFLPLRRLISGQCYRAEPGDSLTALFHKAAG